MGLLECLNVCVFFAPLYLPRPGDSTVSTGQFPESTTSVLATLAAIAEASAPLSSANQIPGTFKGIFRLAEGALVPASQWDKDDASDAGSFPLEVLGSSLKQAVLKEGAQEHQICRITQLSTLNAPEGRSKSLAFLQMACVSFPPGGQEMLIF